MSDSAVSETLPGEREVLKGAGMLGPKRREAKDAHLVIGPRGLECLHRGATRKLHTPSLVDDVVLQMMAFNVGHIGCKPRATSEQVGIPGLETADVCAPEIS